MWRIDHHPAMTAAEVRRHTGNGLRADHSIMRLIMGFEDQDTGD
jgi:hypothetical protein